MLVSILGTHNDKRGTTYNFKSNSSNCLGTSSLDSRHQRSSLRSDCLRWQAATNRKLVVVSEKCTDQSQFIKNWKRTEKNDEKEWRAATGTAITHRLPRPPEIAMLVVSENCVDALYHSDSMPMITVFCSPHPRRIGNESRDEKFKINTRITIENVSSGSSHGGLGDGYMLESHFKKWLNFTITSLYFPPASRQYWIEQIV